VCVCVCERERERERDVTSMHRVDFRNRREASRDAMARLSGPPSVRRQHSPMAASVAWLMIERELNQRVLHCCSLKRHLLEEPSDVGGLK